MSAAASDIVGTGRPLKSRDRLMAMLDVEGRSPKEIATFLQVSTQYVYQVQRSPLYQAQLQDLRERLEATRIDRLSQLVDRLHNETGKSLDTIVSLRDNANGKIPPAVRLGAATVILDRVLPRKQEQTAQEANNVVIIGDEAARRMALVLAEAGIKPSAPMLATKTLDEFAAAEEAQLVE